MAACGDDAVTDPGEVELGETTYVFVLNPTINDVNQATVPPPGSEQNGVDISIQDGPSGTTGADGVAVFGGVDAGTRSVTFDDGSGGQGTLSLSIADRDLRQVAVALDGSGAATMANVLYAFGGEVVEITADQSVSEVNEALAGSNRIVLVRGGTYTGNIDFSGSNVTLFGEGPEGGNVTLDGNVTVSGSNNRVRGARITGDLAVPGSDAGIAFSSVVGSLIIDGSDAVLVNNAFCGTVDITGGGITALGNAGLAPVPDPATC
jgi:hypothetical protein